LGFRVSARTVAKYMSPRATIEALPGMARVPETA
jgi:hypothetical protein